MQKIIDFFKKFTGIFMTLAILTVFAPLAGFSARIKTTGEEVPKTQILFEVFSGLKFRSIGPAIASGRIADFAKNPENPDEYYVAVASGHIWKTSNNGVTYTPVFDNYGAYSIGCLAMDPKNHNVVWAGTGENNHQRALGYGNGVYKTEDGGKSWKNMGLKESRQIGKIIIDPRNSNIVYVAAEGSAWGPGGDRGLYKTQDGGKTWKKILEISGNTGVNNIAMDPGDPDLLYVTSEQRRRHVHTKIGGGPETAFYKSTDGGNTWKKLTSGLPTEDMGGNGIAISPANPDVVYAIIEAANGAGGFFRSDDRGESWKKMSDYSSSGQYYNEIYCDPKDVDKVYALETVSKVTEDGGKTFRNIGNKHRHVDDHAMWIDPINTKHFMIGGDGGIYETFDNGENWHFKSNLPVTQFYRVSVDNALPFYNVYGGTQDNNSLSGPSRNLSKDGVPNYEWYFTDFGDGFWSYADPKNTDIIYAESQYGNIVRYDKKSGESIAIRPEPRKGEYSYRWNWDTPFIISPHSNTRLYCAANKIFRSDDRGNTWQVISEDITAQIDRNTWPVMDRYWSVDAVEKDVSTSLYGTVVSLVESPVKEGLLYVGTDDGLIQVTENNGKSWLKISTFPGVPANTYVSDIWASRFDENIVYASFNNLKRDDFKPYILKSDDKGKTWISIASDLPKNGTVHTILQDYINPELLFTGTEFGVFFSINGGKEWTQLKAGLPVIAVKDMDIQQRENDLVLATFGRGFYILDDYSCLRHINPGLLNKDAFIFPVKDALMYIQKRNVNVQGETHYLSPNPPFGATFTYYLKDSIPTMREIRHSKEKVLFEQKMRIPQPPEGELRAEANEEKPCLLFTIYDQDDQIIRRLSTSPEKGVNRVTWDLRYESPYPVELTGEEDDPWSVPPKGMLAMPGKYKVTLSKSVNGKITSLVGPVEFNAVVLNNTTLPAADRKALVEFQGRMAEMIRTVNGSIKYINELSEKVKYIKLALIQTPGASPDLIEQARKIELDLNDILFTFNGKTPKASTEENPPAPVPVRERLNSMIYAQWRSTSAPTQTQIDVYNTLKEELPPVLERLQRILETDIKSLETEMEKLKSPWTPGRLPILK